ncbi:hypothetical protein WG66_006401 [Moniliophthora roreri]|nr:hypothetical protein WG66_006401 [Moniliophthora roreri]
MQLHCVDGMSLKQGVGSNMCAPHGVFISSAPSFFHSSTASRTTSAAPTICLATHVRWIITWGCEEFIIAWIQRIEYYSVWTNGHGKPTTTKRRKRIHLRHQYSRRFKLSTCRLVLVDRDGHTVPGNGLFPFH